jgi:transcriptional regulator with XRE-family HTH domain
MMRDDTTAAPQLIRDRREKLKLTQEELAARVGVPTQTIKQWESGRRSPAADKIRPLALALKVDPLLLLP